MFILINKRKSEYAFTQKRGFQSNVNRSTRPKYEYFLPTQNWGVLRNRNAQCCTTGERNEETMIYNNNKSFIRLIQNIYKMNTAIKNAPFAKRPGNHAFRYFHYYSFIKIKFTTYHVSIQNFKENWHHLETHNI